MPGARRGRRRPTRGRGQWFGWAQGLAELFGWAEITLDGFGDDGPAGSSAVASSAALGAWRKGDLRKARALGEHSIARARPDRPADMFWACWALYCTEILEGHIEQALHAVCRSIEAGREAENAYLEAFGYAGRAHVLGYAGRLEAARADLASGTVLLRTFDNPSLQAYFDYIAGEVRLERHPQEDLPSCVALGIVPQAWATGSSPTSPASRPSPAPRGSATPPTP